MGREVDGGPSQLPAGSDFADGRPAADALAVVKRSLEASEELWGGRADPRGEVLIPSRFSGNWLLVRHPSAGFRVGRWDSGPDVAVWKLPTSAPLEILSVDPSGEPLAWAGIALWVDGLRMTGSTLAWLTGTTGSSDHDGYWRGESVPAGPLSALAFTIAGRQLAYQGHLDALATEVDYPWPRPVLLEAYGGR